MRLPPRGVCRFLGWHVLKLEFWHFARPKLNLSFLFASVFAVFSSKKIQQPAGCTVQNSAQLSVSHRFFRCFPVCVAFRIVFCSVFCHLSTFCTCQLRLAFVFELCAGVWGRGWGGVMTSMRLRLVCSFSFGDLLLLGCFPACVCVCRISHRFLQCFCHLSTFCTCQLRLAFVFELCAVSSGGDGVGGG